MMSLEEIQLSEYGSASSAPSPVNRMMAAFAADFRDGIDINLGVGYVNEQTIPRELVQEALHAVLADPVKYRAALNYGGPAGSQNLIESIRRFYVENRIGGLDSGTLDRTGIIIGPNGASSLLDGIAQVIGSGIVITTDPMYYIYCNYLERNGFRVVAIPEDENGIRTDLLREKLDGLGQDKAAIRFFYIVTVSNPTCTILSNERRRELVEIAARLSTDLGRAVPIFFDKAYEDLVHDPAVAPLESGLLCDRLGLVYEIGTLSKILAPALRIGYMIGQDGPFLRAMVQRTSDTGFSAPLIAQEISSYLLDYHVRGQIDRVREGYRHKALEVKGWIDELLGDVVCECRGGQAGFYYYLTLDGVRTTEGSPFFRFLARTTGTEQADGPPEARKPRVVYIPGEFCVHPDGEMVEVGKAQLRLSYGYEELDSIHSAIEYMGEAAAYAANRRP
ncbi:MAG: aminotransferase class I/II-fold pyridoxal phosphate-dependent enzyme [Planctomycetota bacterium]|jgi:2-aminoadipate transaminase